MRQVVCMRSLPSRMLHVRRDEVEWKLADDGGG